MSAPVETRDFYIYRQRDGTPAVVDSMSRVPEHGKKTLRVVKLPKHDDAPPFLDPELLEKILAAPKDAVDEVVGQLVSATKAETRAPSQPAAGLDPTSVLLGAAVGFGVGVIAARVFRAPTWVIKVGLVLVATTLGGGIYYGWIRSQLGIGQGEVIVHPGTIVDDARRAADAMNQRTAEQKKMLEAAESP